MGNNFHDDLQKIRKETGEKSIKAFAELYLSKYLHKASCSFHEELYEMLYAMSQQRNQRVAIAAPRGSAKSSIVSLIYVLWSVCYVEEDYIIILSDTGDQAVDFLSHVKDELETNEQLIAGFPNICEIGQKPKPSRWKRDEIITRNGIKVKALGAGQKIRGRRHQESRPSLIILDDIENIENTQSAESQEKLLNWFTKAVLKAGSQKTNVIVIGTIQHYDSLLAKLTRQSTMPGWRKKIYKSVISWANRQDLWQKWSVIFNCRETYKDKMGKEAAYIFFCDNEEQMLEGIKVLWSEKEDYYSLMVMREQEGELSFDSEKQNNPYDSNESPLNPEGFHYWDDRFQSEEELFQMLDSDFEIYGTCDPSLGKQGRHGDYSAIITIVKHIETGRLYVLDADITKRSPDELIETILGYCRIRKYNKFAVEANQFQELMVQEIQRRAAEKGIYVPIEPVKNTSNKITRILSLQPLIKSGIIQLCRKHKLLLEQLRYFPKGSHDDGPDALQMVMEACRAREGKGDFVILEGSGADDDDREEEKFFGDRPFEEDSDDGEEDGRDDDLDDDGGDVVAL